MRISDWSSDVCSSDLAWRADLRGLQPELTGPDHRLGVFAAAAAGCAGLHAGDLGGARRPEGPAGLQPVQRSGPDGRRRPVGGDRRRSALPRAVAAAVAGRPDRAQLSARLSEDARRATAGAAEQEGPRALGRGGQPDRVKSLKPLRHPVPEGLQLGCCATQRFLEPAKPSAAPISTIAAITATMKPRMFSSNTRSEEHTSELQSLMRISYAVFCLKKKKNTQIQYYRKRKHNNHT